MEQFDGGPEGRRGIEREAVRDAAVDVVGERRREFERVVVRVALDGVDGLPADSTAAATSA